MGYLIQLRFHGYTRRYAKNLIYDVSRKFNVREIEVPHISLFGPFETDDEERLVSDIILIGKKYRLVPFTIKSFDYFNNQNKVIYLDISPSIKLKSLRKDIAHRLLRFTKDYPIHDTKEDFIFHATIAFKDINSKFKDIWEYLHKQPKPRIHRHYLLRITILKNSRILYEYDLMQRRLLNREEALSRLYWNKTIKLLKELLKRKTTYFNHDIDIQKHKSVWDKIKDFLTHNVLRK